MRNKLLLTVAATVAVIGTVTGVAASSPAAAASGPCGTAAAPPVYRHVIWIWMENHSYSDIIGNTAQAPYINSLASRCGVATDYHNTTHPSLPNYLAATSGLSQPDLPVTSYLDCDVSVVCDTSAASIFGQGETWKSYEESMPSNCDKSNSGEYAVRHNPAVYYTKLSGCASRDVPYTQLATDLARQGADLLLAGASLAHTTELPTEGAHPVIEPLLYVQSFYRMANALSLARGLNPDAPPHLRKVTETL